MLGIKLPIAGRTLMVGTCLSASLLASTAAGDASPLATRNVGLFGVSCPASNRCFAVGTAGLGAPAVIEEWSGTNWSFATVPLPGFKNGSALQGVKCTGVAACTAVGYYNDASSNAQPLIESWNGSTWALQTPPLPAGGTTGSLIAVACSTAACIAVGSYTGGDNLTHGLAEVRTASSWTPNTADAGGVRVSLDGVACGPGWCEAVGTRGSYPHYQTAAERWNGSSWSLQSTSTFSTAAIFYAVSCAGASACTAVGTWRTGTSYATLAERWNGSSWTIQPTSTATFSFLASVTCLNPTSCLAVGEGTNYNPLIESWSGGGWSTQAVAGPPHGQLSAVACSGAGACTAVGYVTTTHASFAFADRWDGSDWDVQGTA